MRNSILHNCKTVFIIAALLILLPLTSGHASQHPYIAEHGIIFSNGNNYQVETDFLLNGPGAPLIVDRYYNSQSKQIGSFGFGWTGGIKNMSRLLINGDKITLTMINGRRVIFIKNGEGSWSNQSGRVKTITLVASGYQLVEANGIIRKFDTVGNLTRQIYRNNTQVQFVYQNQRLISVADSYGKTVTFSYQNDKVKTIITSIGTYTYSYDKSDNLIAVQKPDTTRIQYIYYDPNDLHNLTWSW